MGWREDPEQVRAYTRASWIWVGLFSLRLAVQLPLYLASALTALGAARVAMGIPLFAVGIWLSWLILRPTLHAQRPSRTRQSPRVPSATKSARNSQWNRAARTKSAAQIPQEPACNRAARTKSAAHDYTRTLEA